MTRRLWWVLAAGAVAVGWAGWRAVPAGDRAEVGEKVRARGEQLLVGAKPPRKTVQWPGHTVRADMATCNIKSEKFSLEYDLWIRTSEGSDQANTVVIGGGNIIIAYSHTSGGWHYFQSTNLDPGDGFWWRYPATGEGVQEGGLHYLSESDDCYIEETISDAILGGKASRTHGKEGVQTDSWADVPGATTVLTLTALGDGELGQWSGTWTPMASHTINVTGNLTTLAWNSTQDPDDWGDLRDIGVYPVEISGIKVCGNPVDFGDSYPEQIWYDGGPGARLYEKGVGNAIYLYGDTVGGPQPGWSGLTMSAPYMHDWSERYFKWMDGVEVDPIVVCPTFRLLTEAGADDGPWTGRMSELRALGPVVQTRGWHTKDTFAADVTGEAVLYMDRADAENLGIETGLGVPSLKVAGAGWRATKVDGEITVPSPLDGGYAEDGRRNGQKRYVKDLFELWWDDDLNGYKLGQHPLAIYEQADGGPTGVYTYGDFPNTPIDPETGEGPLDPLPVVTEEEGELAAGSAPSFDHDLVCVLRGWTCAATSRSEDPGVTGALSLEHDANKDIYASAHTHEDWVGTNASTPDAQGNFEVTAPGGYLTLDLASNYLARQAAIPATGAIPVPTCYRTFRHDALYGATYEDGGITYPVPSEVNHEAVYCWAGWPQYGTTFRVRNLGVVATCTISFYDVFAGIGDNHLSGQDRQDEYTFSAGDLHTITQTITLANGDPVDVEGETWYDCPVTVDLWSANVPTVATQIKWAFDTAGDYKMATHMVQADGGDRQEITNVDPYYRTAPSTDGAAYKCFENWRLALGGLSGHFYGMFNRALWCPDQVRGNVLEATVPYLEVVFGQGDGRDESRSHSFETFANLLNGATDAWTMTWDEDAQEEAFLDVDGNALKDANCYDLDEIMAGDLPADLSYCVRVWKINCAPGLMYKHYGTHWVGGRAHGRGLTKEGARARGRGLGRLYRADESDDPLVWEALERIGSDEHGHWENTHLELTKEYTDNTPTYWVFQTNQGPEDGQRGATREWWAYDAEAQAGAALAATWHPVGATVLVADCGLAADQKPGHWKIQRVPSTGLTWSARFSMADGTGYDWGNIVAGNDRTEFCLGAVGNLDLRMANGLDGGWLQAVSLAGYEKPWAIDAQGRFLVAAYASAQAHLLVVEKTADRAQIGTPLVIGASDVDTGPALAWMPEYGLLWAAVQSGGQTTLYSSTNRGATWKAQSPVVDVETPALWADGTRLWLAGYKGTSLAGASGKLVAKCYNVTGGTLGEAAVSADVGGADPGRPALLVRPAGRELLALAVKTENWTESGPSPAIVEYRSWDSGASWALKAYHEVS